MASKTGILGLNPTLLLDITRRIYRRGSHVTGIDRVQAAYEAFVLSEDGWFVTRLGKGLALLDADGYRAFLEDKSTRFDAVAHLSIHRDQSFRLAETRLRKASHWTGPYAAWPGHAVLGDHTYLNVGHSHLETLGTFHDATRRVVWLHDDIPLRFPETQTQRAVTRFRAQLEAVRSHADHVIAPAKATANSLAERLSKRQTLHPIWPGITPFEPVAPFATDTPYFVVLGTIEPRKNLELLLDIWPKIEADLRIVGRIGWKSEAIMERLRKTKSVIHMGPLSDNEARSVVTGARALLFPTLAEGFGLPLLEARDIGVPVIASDIPVFREISDAGVTLLTPQDSACWADCLRAFAIGKSSGVRSTSMNIPRWASHFEKLRPVVNGLMD